MQLDETPIHHHYSLLGRGTVVLKAEKPELDDPDCLPKHDCEFIVKFSWVDSDRIPEPEFIERLLDKCKNDSRVVDHLPWVVSWRDEGLSTQTIRDALRVKPRQRTVMDADGREYIETLTSSRVLRSIVFERLHRISEINDDADFVTVFGGIVRCKYFRLLWLPK